MPTRRKHHRLPQPHADTAESAGAAISTVGASSELSSASVPSPSEFCAQLRRHLAAELDKPSGEDASLTNFQALSAKLVQMAVKGSKDAIHIVLDRLAGRTPQAASGPEEEPVHIEYVIGIPRPDHGDQNDQAPDGAVQAVPPAV
jgi:hypothetical protein